MVGEKKILLVDENDDFLDALGAWLESELEGVRVVARAHSALEAVDQASVHRPDLVISDAFVPGGSGFQIARRLWTVAPGAAFLLLTAYEGHDVEADPRAFGVVACIPKTSVMRKLLPLVRKLLAVRTSEPPPVKPK